MSPPHLTLTLTLTLALAGARRVTSAPNPNPHPHPHPRRRTPCYLAHLTLTPTPTPNPNPRRRMQSYFLHLRLPLALTLTPAGARRVLPAPECHGAALSRERRGAAARSPPRHGHPGMGRARPWRAARLGYAARLRHRRPRRDLAARAPRGDGRAAPRHAPRLGADRAAVRRDAGLRVVAEAAGPEAGQPPPARASWLRARCRSSRASCPPIVASSIVPRSEIE